MYVKGQQINLRCTVQGCQPLKTNYLLNLIDLFHIKPTFHSSVNVFSIFLVHKLSGFATKKQLSGVPPPLSLCWKCEIAKLDIQRRVLTRKSIQYIWAQKKSGRNCSKISLGKLFDWKIYSNLTFVLIFSTWIRSTQAHIFISYAKRNPFQKLENVEWWSFLVI